MGFEGYTYHWKCDWCNKEETTTSEAYLNNLPEPSGWHGMKIFDIMKKEEEYVIFCSNDCRGKHTRLCATSVQKARDYFDDNRSQSD